MNAIDFVHEQLTNKKQFPAFKAGDNISVNYKIVEGNKERIQSFKGDVIKRQGEGGTATFTVRKISDGVGVERGPERRGVGDDGWPAFLAGLQGPPDGFEFAESGCLIQRGKAQVAATRIDTENARGICAVPYG